ncbi:MAG: DUF4279 domain-containing protein [Balneola sp.]|nr:DUF4279 domain-containing protein [Balneola sp.]MBO6651701.1 DUF4279 domain-containing protein [Balneola sp.]MBO6712861.1 DUF4279 domain-containing protein [Balneola sp.]MBO6801160.1 DUF4279 domain-containing protein [Balneola sp.]MBO6871352.1 DUF4279 domain-containing protein [Balneola sp.]
MGDSKKNKVHIYLKFYDFNVHPDEISKALKLEPTRKGLKGEKYLIGNKNKREQIYKWNYWELGKKFEIGDRWVQEFIDEFVNEIIEPNKGEIKKVIKKGDGEFSVVPYFYSEANPGFFFESSSIDILSAANLSFNLDIYSL